MNEYNVFGEYQIFTKFGTDYLQTTITLTCQNKTELRCLNLVQILQLLATGKTAYFFYSVTELCDSHY